jgi:hypothetical protein
MRRFPWRRGNGLPGHITRLLYFLYDIVTNLIVVFAGSWFGPKQNIENKICLVPVPVTP